jgi:hypothetical protein
MNRQDEIICQITLKNIVGTNYLFEIYQNGIVQITSEDIIIFRNTAVREVTEQTEIFLIQEQMDSLLNAVDDFINESLNEINLQATDPSFFFCVTVNYNGTVRELDGSIILGVDENGNYIQTEAAQKLMLVLNEISPIPIIFTSQNF